MSLSETLDNDFKSAMKAKDALKLSCLRLIKSALTNYQIEKKKSSLEDAEILDVIQKQVKQRRESYESYTQAGRNDLAEKEKQEIDIINQYLPKGLTDEEIRALVQKAIQASQAKTKADLGKVMKELMPAVKGRADGKRVNEIVLQLLG